MSAVSVVDLGTLGNRFLVSRFIICRKCVQSRGLEFNIFEINVGFSMW